MLRKKIYYNIKHTTLLIKACEYGYEDIVKLLIEHGANVNEKTNDNEEAIIVACRNGNEDILKGLFSLLIINLILFSLYS